jgi:hypothetical protein
VGAGVPRKFSDFVLTGLALVVLVGLLVAISPPLREQLQDIFLHSAWDVPAGIATNAAEAGFAVISDFAGDNGYLFSFLIAACVFFFLMLKVIT